MTNTDDTYAPMPFLAESPSPSRAELRHPREELPRALPRAPKDHAPQDHAQSLQILDAVDLIKRARKFVTVASVAATCELSSDEMIALAELLNSITDLLAGIEENLSTLLHGEAQ